MGIFLDDPAAEGALNGLHGRLGRRAGKFDLDADRANLSRFVTKGRGEQKLYRGWKRGLRHQGLRYELPR